MRVLRNAGPPKAATYTSIDNANLDALAGDARISELVHLGHQVRRELVPLLPLGKGALNGIARGMDGVVRHGVAPDRKDALDLWHFSHLGGHLVGILGVLELDGCTLEQLEAEVLPEGGLAAEVIDERIRVLCGSESVHARLL
jgi:hypothetical protein